MPDVPGRTIGIDLGGTKVLGIVLEGTGVVAEAKRPTDASSVDGVVKSITSVIEDLGGATGVSSIGIGAPGLIDGLTGSILRAPNLAGFDRPVPLAALVSAAAGGTPVRVDNDVRVAVGAEHRLGCARDVNDVLGVWVGTGVGGGLVLDGSLRVGPTGGAGEIGHVIVKPGRRRCGCGGRGHLEAYAGRAGMERKARRLHKKGKKTKLVELAGDDAMRSGVWADALEAGDKVAEKLIAQAVDALATAIASEVALLDVPFVVVGGGLGARLGEPFIARIEAGTKALITIDGYPLRVMASELGDRGGAIGAGLLAAGHFRSGPPDGQARLHVVDDASV